MPSGIRLLALTLVVASACAGDNSSPSTEADATTGTSADASTSAPMSTTSPTSGSTTTAADASSGAGGQGSEAACLAWHKVYTDSIRPLCECEVDNGFFDTVEECLATATSPPECMCELFGESPGSEAMFVCYEEADRELVACLEALGSCPDGAPLQACYDQEAVAIEACGFPSAEACEPVFTTCSDSGPFGACTPP